MPSPATCARCSTPLAPQGLYAAYHTTVDYCCATCAAGKQCVCTLIADPARGRRFHAVPDDSPLIPTELSRTVIR